MKKDYPDTRTFIACEWGDYYPHPLPEGRLPAAERDFWVKSTGLWFLSGED